MINSSEINIEDLTMIIIYGVPTLPEIYTGLSICIVVTRTDVSYGWSCNKNSAEPIKHTHTQFYYRFCKTYIPCPWVRVAYTWRDRIVTMSVTFSGQWVPREY